MFLKFSKGEFCEAYKRTYLKAVFIGNTLVMECGEAIIDVVVAGRHAMSADVIARKIKDMICKANKFCSNPSTKRRKYQVEVRPCEALPVTASIILLKV